MVGARAGATRRGLVRWVSTNYTVKTQQGAVTIALNKVPTYIGMHSDRGMRNYNEDRMSAFLLELPIVHTDEKRPVFNFNIFDGHGGNDVVDFISRQLPKYVEDYNLDKSSGRALAERYKNEVGGYWRTWRSKLPQLDRRLANAVHDDLMKRLPLAYLTADLDISAEHLNAGSTATCVYVYSLTDRDYWDGAPAVVTVAQVGDTRALIVDNQGNVLPLTTTHHPSNPHETERLTAFSHAFINGNGESSRFLQFTNTRSFGDFRAKEFGLSAEPDLTTYLLGQKMGRLPGDEAFLVLISDGVTDKASDQEIADLVIQSSSNRGLRGTPQIAATEIVNYVVDLGTSDNASAMVVRLGGWGKWDGWTDRSGKTRNMRLMQDTRRRQ